MAETEKKTKKAERPANNIQFVGKRKKYNPDRDRYEDVLRDAPKFVMDGGERMALPDGIEKGAFVEPNVRARLTTLFPNDFKEITEKGASNNGE